ncbi:MAG TPA: DUF2157 domain-containing protein [Candidatus Binatia bacterium]|nr:DUF2157 domain-containing protein [Candidatus Binatia bacterium]
MSLNRKLARWEAAGLIDGPTGARIRAFEKSSRAPIALYALGVLGAGTVALGIISLIAANWDAIPATMKLAGDLLIGLVLAMATYVAVRRGGGWPGEVLIMLLYGFTLASIALVGQVYQLTNPTYQALLVWSAATLPLVLLGRSYALAALAAAGIALTHTVTIWPLIDVLEPGLAGNRDRSAAILFASPLLYVVLARVPWLVRNRPELSRTVTALAWVAVLVGGVALQLVWYAKIDRDHTLGWSLAVTAAIAAAVAVALPRLHPDMDARPRRTLAAILAFAWLTLALGTAIPRANIAAVGAILQVVWLGLFAWASIQLGLVRAFNALTTLIAVRVLVIYFEVFGSLLSTGVGLITGGVLTLLVGWLWHRKTTALAARLRSAGESGAHVA